MTDLPAPDPDETPAPSDQSESMRAALQARVVSGAAWTMVNTLVSVPVAFLVNLLIARVLGVVDYGRLALLTTLMEVLAAAIAVGVGGGVVQFGARAHAAGRRDEVRHLLSAAQGYRLMVEAPIVTVVLVVVTHVEPVFLITAVVFGVFAPAAFSGGPNALTIENKTAVGAKIVLVSGLFLQCAVAVTVVATNDPDAVWLVRLMFNGLIAISALWFVSRDYRRAVLRPLIPPRFPRGFWRYSAPAGVAGLIGILVSSRTEVFALEWWSTPASVGAFALAFGLAAHLFSPAQALVGPLVPAIAGLREVDVDAVWPALLRTVRAGATVSGLILATALPALTLVVPVLYGNSFSSVGPMLMVAGFLGGLIVTGNPLAAFVQARLDGRTILHANGAGLLVDVVAIVALVPRIGAWGAVIANGLGVLTRLGLLLMSEARSHDTPLWPILRRALPVLLGGCAGALAWSLAGSAPMPAIPGSLLSAGIGALIFVLLMLLFRTGLTTGDSAALLGVLPPRFRPLGRWALTSVARSTDDARG